MFGNRDNSNASKSNGNSGIITDLSGITDSARGRRRRRSSLNGEPIKITGMFDSFDTPKEDKGFNSFNTSLSDQTPLSGAVATFDDTETDNVNEIATPFRNIHITSFSGVVVEPTTKGKMFERSIGITGSDVYGGMFNDHTGSKETFLDAVHRQIGKKTIHKELGDIKINGSWNNTYVMFIMTTEAIKDADGRRIRSYLTGFLSNVDLSISNKPSNDSLVHVTTCHNVEVTSNNTEKYINGFRVLTNGEVEKLDNISSITATDISEKFQMSQLDGITEEGMMDVNDLSIISNAKTTLVKNSADLGKSIAGIISGIGLDTNSLSNTQDFDTYNNIPLFSIIDIEATYDTVKLKNLFGYTTNTQIFNNVTSATSMHQMLQNANTHEFLERTKTIGDTIDINKELHELGYIIYNLVVEEISNYGVSSIIGTAFVADSIIKTDVLLTDSPCAPIRNKFNTPLMISLESKLRYILNREYEGTVAFMVSQFDQSTITITQTINGATTKEVITIDMLSTLNSSVVASDSAVKSITNMTLALGAITTGIDPSI